MVALPSSLAVRALAALVGALFLLGVGYRLGVDAADNQHKADLADHLLRAEEQARAIALQDAEVTAQEEAKRERIRTIYRDIEREVTKYVEADCGKCGLTPDGLKLFNDALTGAARRADPGKQADPVPKPPAADEPTVRGPSPGVDPRLRKVL